MVFTSYSQNSMTEKTCKEEENGGRRESKTQLLKYKLIKTGKTQTVSIHRKQWHRKQSGARACISTADREAIKQRIIFILDYCLNLGPKSRTLSTLSCLIQPFGNILL